ncbi:hypothetical protein [Natrinema ejinorense]|uniref:Uncharacterized protein n=1 Tax=Natrinema ejinorense TaxID=373386 RepID=A0A2A5QPB0_9EURY|nr:hypothetical protein [Natrinema ejinorense]PCR88667.1 hypothetical protein CP557_21805 [Natrinema ejinorense]
MTVNAYNASSDRYECDDDILAAAPENPVRFLETHNDDFVWQGMIDGIDDLDRLEAYRQAEKRHIDGRYNKTKVHKYIDQRERELTDGQTPNATAEPVPATDGGKTVTESATRDEIVAHEDDHDEPHPVFNIPHTPVRVPVKRDDADDADTLHPDVKGLDAGEVLVLERVEPTEYIFPATTQADAPYLLRTETDETVEQLTFDRILARLEGSPDPSPLTATDVRPPANAATNGGGE